MRPRSLFVVLLLCLTGALGNECQDKSASNKHEDIGHALFTSPQVDSLALSDDGSRLYVALSMPNMVKVFDTASRTVTDTILVGIDPVSVEMRPDGSELWVANHVSDSISIIDTDPESPTFHEVIATIEDVGPGGETHFDEPVDIAFASNSKAYVSLSSRNDVAVIDVATRSITKRVHITAQEPRALAVRAGRLYVASLESGNQSELSVCPTGIPDPGEPAQNCTLDQGDIQAFVTNPNIPGVPKNIIVDPDVPDRDLFVFDTTDESVVDEVQHVGTLLYGIAVDSAGTVFVAQTDARNTDNGLEGDNLIDLQNRIFLNQIAEVDCSGGGSCSLVGRNDLEEAPGQPVTTPLATPYGIAISGDDSTLVITAAASGRLATLDASNPGLGGILDSLDLTPNGIPRSVELVSDGLGAPQTAYVLNNLGMTLSVVDVSNPSSLSLIATVGLGGTEIPHEVRRGRIAFNNAAGSSSGTFACASCHPDGNTDQLLWRIGGACSFGACSEDDEPRSTMPVRGLKNTLPLHWDGTLGDPFGGSNGAIGNGSSEAPDCDLGGPEGDHDCFRDLVDASLAGVMCEQVLQGSGQNQIQVCNQTGPSGQAGLLTGQERDDMAHFLASVWYPPARGRRVNDTVSASAADGFRDFFMDQGGVSNPSTCADSVAGCHSLPLMTDTNSATLQGFDVPTMRGLNDRFLQFSLGITAAEEVIRVGTALWDPADGFEENVVFDSAFLIFTPVYNVTSGGIFSMVEELSTGTSGAVGRQVQLEGPGTDYALLTDLEDADARDVVNLRGDGVFDGTPITITYVSDSGLYQVGGSSLSRAQLETQVDAGNLRGLLTAFLPLNFGTETHPQPVIAPPAGSGPTGNPNLDFLDPLPVIGTGVRTDAVVFVDGLPVGGSVSCTSVGDFCIDGSMSIDFASGVTNGMHLVQLQNPKGPLSNEVPVCEGPANGCL